jgi:demethylmenaquinone methyltransferase/2-methoxy-6-polyprenyl-1,4-benzoquinol methylase
MDKKVVKPYSDEGEKKEQVERMFDNIAHRYDFLNHFFSLGIDIRWRRKALKLLKESRPKRVLDVATGTGDFAIQAITMNMGIEKITGVDISNGMLEVGRNKIRSKGVSDAIEMVQADAEALPFGDSTYDAAIVAFGVRNFQNLSRGLADIHRVLRNGGNLVVIEFSQPQSVFFKYLFRIYFHGIMPFIGKLISKDERAYTYLPESVESFPSGEAFIKLLQQAGFREHKTILLSGGIASIYFAKK